MFAEEFFFSFSLLVYAIFLFTLGSAVLLDAFRRLIKEWWATASRRKNGNVVPVVDGGRPASNSIREGTEDLLQRPLTIPDKEIG